jgi:hypothetical protein
MTDVVSIRNQSMRRAFSFAEVMFAVIILGVGFIMVAAMFPVAIRQSKSNADEAGSAAAGRAAANAFAQNIRDTTAIPLGMTNTAASPTAVNQVVVSLPMRISGVEAPTTLDLWDAVRGNVISATDPRYAWVPFYFRGKDNANNKLPSAQLILICVQSTLSPTFQTADVQPTGTAPVRANLRGRPVRVTIVDSPPPDPDYIGFAAETNAAFDKTLPNAVDAVAEGTYVIIRGTGNNTGSNTNPPNSPSLIGRIYRVGAYRPDIGSSGTITSLPGQVDSGNGTVKSVTVSAGTLKWFELAPGNDFNVEYSSVVNTSTGSMTVSSVNPPTNAPAWVVGRSFANLNDPTKGFDGPAMDVAAYSTNVYCSP